MSYDLTYKVRRIIESVENQRTRVQEEIKKSARNEDAVALVYWQGKLEAYNFVTLKLQEALGWA